MTTNTNTNPTIISDIPNEIKDGFKCPIARDLMVLPVILSCGHTFDQLPITQWFQSGHTKCPICQQLSNNSTFPIPNLILKNMIDEYVNNSSLFSRIDRDRFLERRGKAQEALIREKVEKMTSAMTESSLQEDNRNNTSPVSTSSTSISCSGAAVPVVWYWRDGAYWRIYGKYTTSVIERALVQSHQIVNLPGSNNTYMIDLTSMKQVNRYTGYPRDVQRFRNTRHNTVQWEWQADDASWTGFSLDVNTQLEGSYQLNLSRILVTISNSFSYVMDTTNMVQINNQTGTQRGLRRAIVQQRQSQQQQA